MTQSTNEQGSFHVRSLCVLDRKQLAITCPLHQYGGSKALSLHTEVSLNSTLFITAINTNRLHTLALHHSCPQRPLTIQDFKRAHLQCERNDLSKLAHHRSHPSMIIRRCNLFFVWVQLHVKPVGQRVGHIQEQIQAALVFLQHLYIWLTNNSIGFITWCTSTTRQKNYN